LKAKEIVVAGHINPDGDSIGSLLSLGLGLQKIGKKVYMLSSEGVPKRYRSLPGSGRILRSLDREPDLAISVDCSNKEILGPAYGVFKKASCVIEIDHHDFRRSFGDVQVIDHKAAAVGEMIYALIRGLGVPITKEIAQNLMTSIVVETNSFRMPSVRPYTFEVCTSLAKTGINYYNLVEMIYWSKRKESALLSGLCLSRCKFLKEGRLAWSVVKKRDFLAAKAMDEDVDPVPDEMRSIRSVKVAVLFREKSDNILRVSLRSKDRINVAAIAEHYNGGGHFDVAGCYIKNSTKAIREFLDRIERLF